MTTVQPAGDDLVKRLRDADENSQQRVLGSRIFGEAADTITSLHEQVAALQSERANLIETKRQQLAANDAEITSLQARLLDAEKGLEPFADVGELFELETEGFADTDELPLMTSGEEFRLHVLKFGDFITARSTLRKIKGE